MTVSFIIITMTEFYNRYRDLFKAGLHKYKNVPDRQQFLSTEPHYVPPTFSKPTNHINISRSPALEEVPLLSLSLKDKCCPGLETNIRSSCIG